MCELKERIKVIEKNFVFIQHFLLLKKKQINLFNQVFTVLNF